MWPRRRRGKLNSQAGTRTPVLLEDTSDIRDVARFLYSSDKKTQLDEIVARLRRLNPALATADLCKGKILVANDLPPFEANSEYLHD